MVNNVFDTNLSFEDRSLMLFRAQAGKPGVYQDWCRLLGVEVSSVAAVTEIPFLPVSFFKTHRVGGAVSEGLVFESSGTTGQVTSRHYVPEPEIYERAFFSGFENAYGPVVDYVIIGLLPAYLERPNSSLVYMVDKLIGVSGQPESGFFLYEYDRLSNLLQTLASAGRKTILIGVTFALLEMAGQHPVNFPDLIVMETGGMKGRHREITRYELHNTLTGAFGVQKIHSEYGMTELLSQAYSRGDGIFRCSPSMRVLVREADDPLLVRRQGRGLINVIDLANVHSCAFVATDDIALLHADGSFEVQGRADNSDVRGCNLMMA